MSEHTNGTVPMAEPAAITTAAGTGGTGIQLTMAQAAEVPLPGPDGKPEVFPRDYVESLRRESANYREKLREAETRLKAADEAKLTELERAQKEANEAKTLAQAMQAELKQNRVKAELALSASRLRLADPEAAFRLLDYEAVQFDDAGRPVNLETIITEVIKRFPILIASATAPTTAPNNPARQADSSLTLTREQIATMTPDQINQNWPAVQAFLSRNK